MSLSKLKGPLQLFSSNVNAQQETELNPLYFDFEIIISGEILSESQIQF